MSKSDIEKRISSLFERLGINLHDGDLKLQTDTPIFYQNPVTEVWNYTVFWSYKEISSNAGILVQVSQYNGDILHFDARGFEAPENLDVIIDKQTALDIAKKLLEKNGIGGSDSVTAELMIVRKNNEWSKSDVAPFLRERATRLVWNVTFGDELCELISVYVDVEDGSIDGGL